MDRVVGSIIYLKGDGSAFEHVGTYSELWQKLKEQNMSTRNNNNDKKQPAKETFIKDKNSHKLSYNQKRLLEILPTEISQLDQDIAKLVNELSNPDLYQNNPQRFDEASAELDEKQKLKAEKEEKWLEISILADECVN